MEKYDFKQNEISFFYLRHSLNSKKNPSILKYYDVTGFKNKSGDSMLAELPYIYASK